MRIEGSSALVTGGASGLGEATVRELCARGAEVMIADVNVERGERLAAETGARFLATDVSNAEEMESAVAATGALRISVHCAAIGWGERVASKRGPHALEPFEHMIAVNLTGTFNAMRFAAAAMLANDLSESGERGVVINTASTAYVDGQIGQAAYSASKGAVVAMTLPAARDLAGMGVRVCAIAPGLFDTPALAGLPAQTRDALCAQLQFPSRLGRPSEYAQLACHIVENGMLNGEVIRLDGALRMTPR